MIEKYTPVSVAEKKVEENLKDKNINTKLVLLPTSAATAQMAADALGCEVGQIVKSLVFDSDKGPIFIAVSGKNRVDIQVFENQTGIQLKKADAGFVKTHTGFSIGGVSPAGISDEFTKFTDADLQTYEHVWCAGGSPQTVFRVTIPELLQLNGPKIVKVN